VPEVGDPNQRHGISKERDNIESVYNIKYSTYGIHCHSQAPDLTYGAMWGKQLAEG